jgi:hypothetical protein
MAGVFQAEAGRGNTASVRRMRAGIRLMIGACYLSVVWSPLGQRRRYGSNDKTG